MLPDDRQRRTPEHSNAHSGSAAHHRAGRLTRLCPVRRAAGQHAGFQQFRLRADTIGTRGGEIDQLIDIAIAFFAITKFYLLFSFLFGVGFAMQMRRMAATNRPFVGFYLRRLLILLVIGFAHAILLWDGDILRLYAPAVVAGRWCRNSGTLNLPITYQNAR